VWAFVAFKKGETCLRELGGCLEPFKIGALFIMWVLLRKLLMSLQGVAFPMKRIQI
jgi:hypothetical protein